MMKCGENYFAPQAVEALLCTDAASERYTVVLRSGRMLQVRMTCEEADRLAGRQLDFMSYIQRPNVSTLNTEE